MTLLPRLAKPSHKPESLNFWPTLYPDLLSALPGSGSTQQWQWPGPQRDAKRLERTALRDLWMLPPILLSIIALFDAFGDKRHRGLGLGRFYPCPAQGQWLHLGSQQKLQQLCAPPSFCACCYYVAMISAEERVGASQFPKCDGC